MSPAEIEMVSCVLLTNVVSRDVPLKFTVAPVTKFKPFTASIKAGLPATTLDGLKDEIEGGGRSTLKLMTFEAPPPGEGFTTVILKTPLLATSLTKIEAASCVELTNVVGRATPS